MHYGRPTTLPLDSQHSHRPTWPTLVFLVVAFLIGKPVRAQITTANIDFTPSSPTVAQVITARVNFSYLACNFSPTIAVNGNIIQQTMDVTGCQFGPPSSVR